jgi:hypothetical protein
VRNQELDMRHGVCLELDMTTKKLRGGRDDTLLFLVTMGAIFLLCG